MKKLLVAAAVLLTSLATVPAVRAEMPAGEHGNIGLGFHNTAAPIGVRWWLSGQKVGIDLGFGYSTEPAPTHPDEDLALWSLDVGVPFVMHSWDRAHILFRPGILYSSQEFDVSTGGPPLAFDTETGTTLDIAAEIEAEVFLVDKVSVSASHGIAFSTFNPPGPGDSRSTFTTFGNNITQVGFHVYFLGN
jgi:hypothetical protein